MALYICYSRDVYTFV